MEIVRGSANEFPDDFKYYLISIDPLSAGDELKKYLEDKGVVMDTEVLVDPYKLAAGKFGVKGIPRTFVIAKTGEIIEDIEGAVDDYNERLREGIRKAREHAP